MASTRIPRIRTNLFREKIPVLAPNERQFARTGTCAAVPGRLVTVNISKNTLTYPPFSYLVPFGYGV
jgi:hypothetical protein